MCRLVEQNHNRRRNARGLDEETRPRLKRVKLPRFLVAYGHKLRCLHWEDAGDHIKMWNINGQQQSNAGEHDHFSKLCSSEGSAPGGDTETARADEDTGSSYTDE